MYAEFKAALIADAALVIDNTLPDLENTFAPVPPKSDDSWLNTLLGLVALGVPVVGGKFFDSGKSLVSPIFFPRFLTLLTHISALQDTRYERQERRLPRSLQVGDECHAH
jgi:hypothetical protein